jgi:hypothetical protein
MAPSPLFHVAARALPAGRALRPYAVARDYPALVRLAREALDAGPDAVRLLLAGEAWGRLLGQGGHQAEMVLLEAAFERARVRTAPWSPSRLDAVYAWGTFSLADRFRAEYRPTGIIHRCVLVAGTTVERDGALVVEAFEVANLASPSGEDLRRLETRAARYWRAQAPMALPELLVHGTVVVGAVVEGDDVARPT